MPKSILPLFRRDSRGTPHQIPMTGWMNYEAKNHFIASLGEFVGTVLFLFFAFGGTQVANTRDVEAGRTNTTMIGSNTSILLYIALSFGFSLAVNAWIFFRVSGGLFNPAVTLAIVLVGAMPVRRGIYIFISQIIGGIAASAIISALLPGALTVHTSLNGTSIVRGLFIEMFCTCLLVFTILMLAVEKHRATFIAPIGIGLALFVSELVGVFYTGGSLNPTRSFGPAVVDGKFDGYHWIYWVGPGLGAILAAAFYKLIKTLEYETANPDQDAELENTNSHKANPPHRFSDTSTLSPVAQQVNMQHGGANMDTGPPSVEATTAAAAMRGGRTGDYGE